MLIFSSLLHFALPSTTESIFLKIVLIVFNLKDLRVKNACARYRCRMKLFTYKRKMRCNKQNISK